MKKSVIAVLSVLMLVLTATTTMAYNENSSDAECEERIAAFAERRGLSVEEVEAQIAERHAALEEKAEAAGMTVEEYLEAYPPKGPRNGEGFRRGGMTEEEREAFRAQRQEYLEEKAEAAGMTVEEYRAENSSFKGKGFRRNNGA